MAKKNITVGKRQWILLWLQSRAIPLTDKGYTLVLPEGDEQVMGITLFLDGWRVKSGLFLEDEASFERICLRRNLGILRLTTGNPPKRESYAEGSSPHTWTMVDDDELAEWLLKFARR